MYIRKVTQKNSKTGKQYHTYRLSETYRTTEGKVRQRVLLNLGKNFDLPMEQWKLLADRIEEILIGQESLFAMDSNMESMARSVAKRIIQRESAPQVKKTQWDSDYQTVDLGSIQYQNVRQVGGEHVGVEIAKQLGLPELLAELKFNRKQINVAMGSIIGRLIVPGSERATHKYLQTQSALDELLGCDFQKISLDSMYLISDKLEKHKATIEARLFQREKDLFQLSEVITLYDLTNTYFEGKASGIRKAAYGRSKEKRNDCPLVTLGLVLDASGFPKQSEVFDGNISEPKTLEKMIGLLKSTEKPTIVMDAGIATEENVKWLQANGYSYIVVSRKKLKQVDFSDGNVRIKHKKHYEIKTKLEYNQTTDEHELYCYSEMKKKKEDSMRNKSVKRFEDELKKISSGLTKKGGVKRYTKVVERVGKLKQRYSRINQLYDIEIISDKTKEKATSVKWKRVKKYKKDPGVYCLRSNRKDLDEQALWSIYTMLTDLESAFRCLKSELGLRPIYHQKTVRVDSHIFISVIAYHFLHSIRYQLKAKGIHESWKTLREELRTHCRITSTIKSKNGKTIHIRKSSQPTPRQADIYVALEVSKIPGKTEKSIF